MAEERAASPQPVGRSRWWLPDPEPVDEKDEDDGLMGVGADLAVETLVDAYRRGMFPWPHAGMPLPWFSPHPRAVIVPERVHVSRSLGRRLRGSGWETTVDAAFGAVTAACAQRKRSEGTWITREMRRAYERLQARGWAHSVEVWDGDDLVGGIYGVRVGAVFTGESMFHRATDASKVALVDLCRRWSEAGGVLVDVQLPTDHLRSMGAEELPRSVFLARLADVRDRVVGMDTGRRPVRRLTPAR
ncbi:MAG: leucyl/phenylalanyl-tRNA--protein transferase [Acidimicrobiales bacterium]